MTEIERILIGLNSLISERGGTPKAWAIDVLKKMGYLFKGVDGKHLLNREKLARDIAKDNGLKIRNYPGVGRGTYIHIIKIMIEGL